MNTILSWALKLGFLNKLLRPIASFYGKAKGFRTQGLLVAAGVIYAAAFLGYLPMETARGWVDGLLLMAIPTTADKVKSVLDAVSPAAKKLEGMQPPAQA